MKTILLAAGLAFTSMALQAQTTDEQKPATENAAAKPSEDGKVQIKVEELPEAVKKTLADQEYKGWLINTAYHDKKKDRYEVELKNGADTQTIRFSQEGQRLDD